MLKTFEPLKRLIHPSRASIDNFLFKLHYRFTFLILLIATILVTSRQYIGEHIKCISDTISPNVINTFCFVTTTFTVVRHFNNSALEKGAIFAPGIGPYDFQEEPIKRHAYYQWVPFVLFGQALCFIVPHIVWKHWEGGRIKQLVLGLKVAALSRYIHEKLKVGETNIPSYEDTEVHIKDIRREIKYRMRLNSHWGIHLITAELMNLLNIFFQIWWTNVFLGGQFYSVGRKVLYENWANKMDILDVVFPKITKCHFNKFGPSGSLQVHDTLCIMALNIINEKIYTILWFWFAFILIMSILAVLWRFISLVLYKKRWFSLAAFSYAKAGRRINKQDLDTVVHEFSFSNWLFLNYLAANLSDYYFNKVIENLAAEFSESYPSHRIDDESSLKVVTEKPSYSIDTVDAPLLKKQDSKDD